MTGVKKHRAKVREVRYRSEHYAYCRPCKWTGQRRMTLLAAWMDARAHDPLFPQGDRKKPGKKAAA